MRRGACFFVALALHGLTLLSPAQQDVETRLWDLLGKARTGPVSDGDAAWSSGHLDHDDPFVRAMAEWILSERVDRDNAGQEVVWPSTNAPAWFARWQSLTPGQRLECDYARQGMVWEIHRNAGGMLASARKILGRCERASRRTLRGDRLGDIRERVAAIQQSGRSSQPDLASLRRQWIDLRKTVRPLVLSHRALDFAELLFIARHPVHSHRNITGSQYPWAHKPGGDIMRKASLGPSAPARGLVADKLGSGHVHGMDLWWDADRIVFAYARQPSWPPAHDTVRGNDVFKLRREQEPTHLFELDLASGDVRQLTDHEVWSDFEPTYCADGGIVFASDRSGRSSECGKFTADHTGINLHRLVPGGLPRRLTDNKDIDRYPHSLDNGLIAYTRWDYQERHFMEVHSIWTIRPDGSMADAVFNQHMKAPYGFRDTRSVPGSHRMVSIATGHHTLAYGPLVLVDLFRGINDPKAIEIITPYVKPQEGPMAGRPTPRGGVPDRGGVYQTPWALEDDAFLVSYSYRDKSPTGGGDNVRGFALYYVDAYGNKELLHREPLLSCAFPIPLQARPRPPIVPEAEGASRAYAECYLQNAADGMEGVKPGEVKYVRVAQRVGWPLTPETGAKRWIPGNAWERRFGFWSWAPVRVIGDVPVEEDGSARFIVPVDTAVYFQALDANKMELRRMRTHVSLKPGELRGCTGCHESRHQAPAAQALGTSDALPRPPRTPEPPPWGNRKLLGYEWLVQPVLDRHCVSCHGAKEPDGGIDLTGRKAEDGFMQSFRTLFGLRWGETKPGGKKLVSVSNRLSNHSISRVREFGSHRSPFVTVLLDDKLHRDEVKLNPDEWETLATWVDANAPYYDTFFDKRPPHGGEPIRNHRLALLPAFPAAKKSERAGQRAESPKQASPGR